MNKTYFKERLNKLLSFDLIRISKLLELIQYTVLYTILTLPLSILVENIFPAEDRDKSNWIIIFEIIFQMVINSYLERGMDFKYFIREILKQPKHDRCLTFDDIDTTSGKIKILIKYDNWPEDNMEYIT